MTAIENIKARRSIRKFTDQPVTVEDIEKIVEAARFAPSWKNTQTTRYIAVIDPEKKDQIANDAVLGFEFNKKTIGRAPALMVITTVNKRSGYERDGSFTTSKGTHWQSFDAGIATQTFCLAASEMGFGTVILGIYDEAAVKEILGIDENESVSALVPIGYPAAEPEAPARKEVDVLLRTI